MVSTASSTGTFRATRDLLLERREDYDAAFREFRWPELDEFNWALDWFDVVAAGRTTAPPCAYSRATGASGSSRSRTCRPARPGGDLAARTGRRPRRPPDPDAGQPGGAVGDDPGGDEARRRAHPGDDAARAGRSRRPGRARRRPRTSSRPPPTPRKFDDVPGAYTRIAVGEPVDGWLDYGDADAAAADFAPDGPTRADDPLLLYFTSGTTAQPKLVEHTHASLPGRPPLDDVLDRAPARRRAPEHLLAGWAKHAWSNVFAPWNAEATVLIVNQTRFDAAGLLDQIVRCDVTTFCAPPTVWRMLIQEDLGPLAGAGARAGGGGRAAEPRGDRARAPRLGHHDPRRLRPDRDDRADREPARAAAQGRLDGPAAARATPSPWSTRSRAPRRTRARSRSTCGARPLALMTGYRDSAERTAEAMRGRLLPHGRRRHPRRGRLHHLRRPHRRRLQGVGLPHLAVRARERADRARGGGRGGGRAVARRAAAGGAEGVRRRSPRATSRPARRRLRSWPTPATHLAPYKRVRRLEFAALPKTISGKIRRVELRTQEADRHGTRRADRRPRGGRVLGRGPAGAARVDDAGTVPTAAPYRRTPSRGRRGCARGGPSRRSRSARRRGSREC